MSEVKILKPDKDGILREVRTVKVPDYHSQEPWKWKYKNIVRRNKLFKRSESQKV